MNSVQLSNLALNAMGLPNATFIASDLDERLQQNTARVMKEVISQRLISDGAELFRQKGSRYKWQGGLVVNRNSRVSAGFWTKVNSDLNELPDPRPEIPAILLFCHFSISEEKLHVWAIPDDVAIHAAIPGSPGIAVGHSSRQFSIRTSIPPR